MSTQLTALLAFNVFVVGLLAVDLGVFHRKAHEVSGREAAIWSVVWITLGLAFGGLVWRLAGERAGLEYLTGWLIEKSLSVDNLFVFVVIFSYFQVPTRYQHRVLFWGILGALVMRGMMIGAGAYLIHHFHWIIYVFGALLLVTALRMLLDKTGPEEPKGLRVTALVRRIIPVSRDYHGGRFFVRLPTTEKPGERWAATPLLLVLLVVEASDLVFAVDSIPAIFAVTRDPFIVYTSNVFAILGLRALYFVLADLLPRFRLLKPALSIVLAFVGLKMLLSGVIEIPLGLSLAVIGSVLLTAITFSIVFPSGPGGCRGRGWRNTSVERTCIDPVTSPRSEPGPLDTPTAASGI
jgi:tellurite resistance protein TerC